MKALTIATPTYNRAHTLPAVYESLCAQTDKNFIWLVIDDGSTDNTAELVEGWKSENMIEIEYVAKENGGKASALNLGIGIIKTPYAVCLDSDDTFCSDAVEKSLPLLRSIDSDTSKCGILALRNTPDGKVMGGRRIPAEYTEVTAFDVLLKLSLRTEFICFYKMSILKDFRFPEYPGEKFVPPSWMMFAITQDYRYLVSQEDFCVCEYISDGLTKNKEKVIIKNPRGYTSVKLWYFNLSRNMRNTVKNGIMYDCGCILGKDRQCIRNTRKKLWALILFPAGLYVYLKKFRKAEKALMNRR